MTTLLKYKLVAAIVRYEKYLSSGGETGRFLKYLLLPHP